MLTITNSTLNAPFQIKAYCHIESGVAVLLWFMIPLEVFTSKTATNIGQV